MQLEANNTGSNREAVALSWVENWRTLAGIPPFTYQRLLAHAAKRKVTLKDVVAEVLVRYAPELPDADKNLRTGIDLLTAPVASSIRSVVRMSC